MLQKDSLKRCFPSDFLDKRRPTAKMNKLDNFDLILLRELQRDSRQSAEQLTAKIALSTTAIQRRIKRLRDEHVIVAEQAVLDPKALGRSLTLIVAVSLKIGRASINEQFKSTMMVAEEVQQCYAVAGDQDFILIISVMDMYEYEVLTHRLFHSNEAVQKFHTTVVMETVKVGLQIPVPISVD